jgi:hypothetical protein
MASYTLYDASFGVIKDALEALSTILDKIAASPVAGSIAEARIHPDMLPFSFQVHFITVVAHKCLARISAQFNIEDLSSEELTSVDAMKARIAKIQKQLESVTKEAINSRENETVKLGLGPGKPEVDIKAWQYVHGYAVPNIYFHLVTAYDIARKEGVELGKRDFQNPFLGKFINL